MDKVTGFVRMVLFRSSQDSLDEQQLAAVGRQ